MLVGPRETQPITPQYFLRGEVHVTTCVLAYVAALPEVITQLNIHRIGTDFSLMADQLIKV